MSTFNDDLSADMNDPEFAAEFERTTDEVRRERYAAAIAQSEGFAWDPSAIHAEDRDSYLQSADAVMAVADEETRFVQDAWCAAIRMLRASNARLRAELEESRRKECDALCSDVERDRDEYEATISRLRAELSETRRKLTEANVARRDTELDCARQLRILRSDLRESADALDESAQLLEDALNENTRLRAELENARTTLDADLFYLRKYQDTISRVRAVLDEWYGTSDASALSAEIRTALSGESS